MKLAVWTFKNPHTHRVITSKIHSVIIPFKTEVTRCKQQDIPSNADKWDGDPKLLTCPTCINRHYNPKPNRVITHRR